MRTEALGPDLLGRLLAAAELRARVISSNLANQSTPGYTRRVVSFEEELRAALQDGPDPDELAELEPRVLLDEESPARPDGNNVTLELELNALRENRILYETYASMLAGRFRMLEAAIAE
jgi:flagellar basal-body rod protein FlgB